MGVDKGGRSKLERLQQRVIAALLTQPTHERAAHAAGIGLSTLHRWLRLPRFQALYREAREQLVEHAISRMQAVAGDAVDKLRGLLQSENEQVALRAAIAILQQVVELRTEGDELKALRQEVERLLQLAEREAPGATNAG